MERLIKQLVKSMLVTTSEQIMLVKCAKNSFENKEGKTINFISFTALDADGNIFTGTLHRDAESGLENEEMKQGIGTFDVTMRDKTTKMQLVSVR